jgi:hypothetical protein
MSEAGKKRVKINNRLLEIEDTVRKTGITEELKKEWNELLSLKTVIPGILDRQKYEEPKGKKKGKGTKEKGKLTENVGNVPKHLAKTSSL